MPGRPRSPLFQLEIEPAVSAPSSTESSLGVSTAVLTDNLWVSMKRLGKDAKANSRCLGGVNPTENLVWLAYGFDPHMMPFTGGWRDVC